MGAEFEAELLLNVEGATLERNAGRKIEAGHRAELNSLGVEIGYRAAYEDGRTSQQECARPRAGLRRCEGSARELGLVRCGSIPHRNLHWSRRVTQYGGEGLLRVCSGSRQADVFMRH